MADIIPAWSRLAAAGLTPQVDSVFAKFNAATPGCAVGVGVDGAPVLAKAYGMADLEHDVPNTADTIFEGGSVSKQFTAAAVLLLAREGSLSLDDAVRRYLPEGLYRSVLDGTFVIVVRENDGLRIERGAELIPRSSTRFVTAGGQTWDFDGRGHARLSDRYDIVDHERVPAAKPALNVLKMLAGAYASDEAETTVHVAVEDEMLVLTRRPGRKFPLTPVYEDAFNAPGLGIIIFRRDASRRVFALSVVQDRVWDLRFVRQPQSADRSFQ